MTRHSIINRDTQSGVTLVEILVVLVLLGIMTGAVALSIGSVGREGSAAQEADLLAARLNRATDEVVLTATPMRFGWTQDSYHFEIAQDGVNWQPHPVTVLAEDHALSDGLMFMVDGSGNAVTVDANLIPNPREILTLQLSSKSGWKTTLKFDGVNAVVMDPKL